MKQKKITREIQTPDVSQQTERIMRAVLTVLAIVFLMPIAVVLMNSFKGKLYISDTPFALPAGNTFAGIENYINCIEKTVLPMAF